MKVSMKEKLRSKAVHVAIFIAALVFFEFYVVKKHHANLEAPAIEITTCGELNKIMPPS
jgi:hypothetical protein